MDISKTIADPWPSPFDDERSHPLALNELMTSRQLERIVGISRCVACAVVRLRLRSDEVVLVFTAEETFPDSSWESRLTSKCLCVCIRTS
jgi:hypothetical protein